MRLADEDPVITGPQGGRIINPLMPVISSLVNQELRLSAHLRLGALDIGSENTIESTGARKRKQAAEVREQLSEDDPDLILRPRPKAVQ